MRCPDCNKFVSMEFSEPQVDDITVDETGHVTASVELSMVCAECGTELKTGTLELESDHSDECEGHVNEEGDDETHDLEVEEGDVNPIEEREKKKSYFGAEVCFTIKCKCNATFKVDGAVSDKMSSSEMDEC